MQGLTIAIFRQKLNFFFRKIFKILEVIENIRIFDICFSDFVRGFGFL